MQKDIVIGREMFALLICDISISIGTLKGIQGALNTIPIEKINKESLIGLLQECENTLQDVCLKNVEALLLEEDD